MLFYCYTETDNAAFPGHCILFAVNKNQGREKGPHQWCIDTDDLRPDGIVDIQDLSGLIMQKPPPFPSGGQPAAEQLRTLMRGLDPDSILDPESAWHQPETVCMVWEHYLQSWHCQAVRTYDGLAVFAPGLTAVHYHGRIDRPLPQPAVTLTGRVKV